MVFHSVFARSVLGFVGVLACISGTPALGVCQTTGIRFGITSRDSPSPAQDVLGGIAGVVEFGRGRGRLDVDSTSGRDVSINGLAVARPRATAGDYYLFDSTGFVLVRPRDRTFSVFSFARSWLNLGSARDSSEGFMEFVGYRADALPAADASAAQQHGPYTVRWHLDRKRSGTPPIDVLSRGWIDVADAPPGEASAVRWFGAAAALAALSAGSDSLRNANLQITVAVALKTPSPLNLIVLNPIQSPERGTIDPKRLVLPSDFTQIGWSGSTRERVRTNDDVLARWRSMPDGERK